MKRSGLFLLLLFFYFTQSWGTIKIAVISDIHFLSDQLIDEDEAYQAYVQATGRNVGELHLIFDHVIDEIIKEKPDVLFIAGDLTNHGELQSHIDLIKKLEKIKNAGISVFVIPGNHDINIPDSKAYTGQKSTPVSSISKDEFAKLYDSFGFGTAALRDENSLSYCAAIDQNHWLLAFDTNRYAEHTTSSITGGRILSETLNWALEILYQAEKKGITVLGMMHHGLVEHMPYQSAFFSDYLIDDWEKQATVLSDAGLKVVFTGHFHANDITQFISADGSSLYDIETGSLAQYPFPYRILNLYGNELSVTSHFVDKTAKLTDIQNKYRKKLEKISHRMIASKIKNLNIPISEEVKQPLIDLLVKMSLLHVAGDEQMDDEVLHLVENFAKATGDDDFDAKNFSLDFYPSDNNLTIVLE